MGISYENLVGSAGKALFWVERNMLAGDRGNLGVYERLRTDVNERVNLCRPDTAAECLLALNIFSSVTGSDRYKDVFDNITNWLLYAQNTVLKDGNEAFPFYLTEGDKDNTKSKLIYQNDNGKALLILCTLYERTGDPRLLYSARKCADFWLKTQERDGNFFCRALRMDKKQVYGPCFLLWLTAGLNLIGKITKEKKYYASAKKAFALLKTMTRGGRILTSYELAGAEAWRPVSSENYIALLCYLLSYKSSGDISYLTEAEKILPFCLSLIDNGSGAIKNGNGTTTQSSLNNDENLCDFVYTFGYGINALLTLYKTTGKENYLDFVEKAASFALKTQCKEGNPLTDGGWRGSYDIKTKQASGRCDQNNPLDEGGKYSLYAGWCAMPLAYGLLVLADTLRKEGKAQ